MPVLFLTALLLAPPLQPAAVPPEVLLWPNGAPGAVGDETADKPCVFVYQADKSGNTGAAVIVCPGGGYGGHAMDHEGHQVAKFFQSNGVTAALLRYRLGGRYRHPAPLQDISRAVRLIRHNAADLKVDANRVGVIGFSAGGHLASTVSTHWDRGQADADDPIERQSCRPDFSMLCYPVISFTAPYAHLGSARRLLGNDATDEQLAELSNELHVTPETPPTFLFHTGEDTAVPPQNSLSYAMSCAKNEVACELHLFRYGPHGVGMALSDPAASHWRDLAMIWLQKSGFLTAAKRVAVNGAVTFDGEPISNGEVVITPDDPHGAVAAARFGGGKFRFDSSNGPTVGPASVRIVHTGSFKPGPTLEDAVDVSPSGLKVDLGDGVNELNFNLTSD